MITKHKKKISPLETILYSNAIHWLNVVLVSINSFLIGFKPDFSLEINFPFLFPFIVYTFLIIFSVEISLKLLLKKSKFFDRPGDPFALGVLLTCWILNNPDFSILLAFNILRVFHLMEFMPGTRRILNSLEKSLPAIFNIIFIIILIFSIFAILGTHLFGHKNPEYFGTFSASFVTLSQIMVGDDWGNLLRKTIINYPYSWIYYIIFLVLITFILLNAFVGVIVSAINQEFGVDENYKQ